MARVVGWFLVLLSLTCTVMGEARLAPALATVRRQPVALVVSRDGTRLFIANRASGSISTIDTATRKVIAETVVGERLEDLAVLPDNHHFLAIDGARSVLLVLLQNGDVLERIGAIEVPLDPVRISVSSAGGESRVAVTSRWGNRVSLFALEENGPRHSVKLVLKHTIVLPFSPRHSLWLQPNHTLVVADAFGGRIAVIDADQGITRSLRSIPAHNIGGLVFDQNHSHVIITQQFLNHRSETTADSIHWGFLLTNSLRSLKTSDLLNPTADLGAGSHLAHLGEPGHGGGDPAGMAVLPNGDVLTALAGVNEVAMGQPDAPDRLRIAVGVRPTHLVLGPDGQTAYVANTLDDSVSIVDWNSRRSETIRLGPTPALRQIDLGERLFYDARLSHEGWMSCQSCHGDGHTNGRLADTLGDGSFGTPKQVPSLLGVVDTAPFAWNGGIGDLETQVRKSLKTTLRKNETTDEQAHALTAYLKTLRPAPQRLPADLDSGAVSRGRALFNARKCDRCHTPPAYTSAKTYDVGLYDESDGREYNPPSLRGVDRRGSFFHDGRARNLAEVFTRFGHPNDSTFTDKDASDLSMFLRSL